MAWTAPRTWATGLVVTATILNTEVRDNLLELSTHAHNGSAGEGDDQLAGVDSITFDDISDPAAPGTNDTIIWTNNGKLHQRAGAAGVAEEFSVTSHSHTLTENGTWTDDLAADDISETTTNNVPIAPTAEDVMVSQTMTPAGTDSMLVMGGGAWCRNTNVTINMETRVYFKVDSTLENFTEETLNDTGGPTPIASHIVHAGTATGYSGSTVLKMVVTQDGGGHASDLKAYRVSVHAGWTEIIQ